MLSWIVCVCSDTTPVESLIKFSGRWRVNYRCCFRRYTNSDQSNKCAAPNRHSLTIAGIDPRRKRCNIAGYRRYICALLAQVFLAVSRNILIRSWALCTSRYW